ncbi:MAG TPA: DUF2845 domain-containing protein [Gammaproteobacteria bacterium]
MSRRLNKAENAAIGWLIVIGIVFYGISKFFEAVGFAIPLVVVIVVVALVIAYRAKVSADRLAYLRNKYHDEEIVQRILRKEIWQGETPEQLKDSLGSPAEVDDNVLKTKKKEVWKYGQTGVNRFKLRVTVENDVVIGWDIKG